MTTNHNTANPVTATLTKKELFRRFLNLPYDTSKFGDLDMPTNKTIGETVENAGFEAGGWPMDLRECLIEYLRECDDPSTELQSFRNDILGLLGDVKMLENGFDELTEAIHNGKTNAIKPPASNVPAWHDLVDQSDKESLARFFSEMPNADTVSHELQGEVLQGAVDYASFGAGFRVEQKDGQLSVAPDDLHNGAGNELYYCYGGNHAAYGNFALFWSIRGPGEPDEKPRPCFMFWDGEAVMIGGVAA